MELHQIRYFVTVAEAGSFSRAAARCHVAQPSISQQIKKLERSLGEVLFDRLGRGIALTEAGHALLPRAKRILAEVRDVEANIRSDVEAGTGQLVIGAIPTMAPYLLPAALGQMRKAFPRCAFYVQENFTERLVEALIDNRIDCAIMSTPVDHDQIHLDVLGSEPMRIVAPSDHALSCKAELALAELRDEPTVTLNEMHCLGKQLQSFCAARRLATNIVCESTQLTTVLELVGAGLGISVVPEMAARIDRDPSRRYLRFKGPTPRREVAIARRADRTPRSVATRLGEVIRQQLAVFAD